MHWFLLYTSILIFFRSKMKMGGKIEYSFNYIILFVLNEIHLTWCAMCSVIASRQLLFLFLLHGLVARWVRIYPPRFITGCVSANINWYSVILCQWFNYQFDIVHYHWTWKMVHCISSIPYTRTHNIHCTHFRDKKNRMNCFLQIYTQKKWKTTKQPNETKASIVQKKFENIGKINMVLFSHRKEILSGRHRHRANWSNNII